MKFILTLIFIVLTVCFCSDPASSSADKTEARTENAWAPLLDKELSQWEKWLGIPHSSIQGLKAGTYQSENIFNGTPLGLNNDPKSVFSVIEEDGEMVLYITGEIFGGLTSLKSYKNYHLQLEIKWGDKKWKPRLDMKRDSGVLYHCHGKHGAYGNIWKSSLECQVQEKDIGDFIPVAGTKAKFRGNAVGWIGKRMGSRMVFDSTVPEYVDANGYVHCQLEPDYPNGEWNKIDIYVIEDSAIHVVNGVVVMAIKDALDKNGEPLTSGQFQIQSEGAECFYKNIQIRSIKSFPKDLKLKANL